MSKKKKIAGTLMLGLFLASLPGVALGAEDNSIDRVYGKNRYETMLEIALKINPRTANTVVLASGQNFPDALAGVPLAHQKNAPILLVDSTPEQSQEAFSYLQEHFNKQGKVYILGEKGVIPETFVTVLVNLGISPENIVRLGGRDRYETAVMVAKEMKYNGSDFFLVSGENFPDALSVSVRAANQGVPILLISSNTTLSDSVVEYLNGLPGQELKQSFEIIGGTGAVSEAIQNELKRRVNRIALNGVTRLSGSDRYETMRAVNSGCYTPTWNGSSTVDAVSGIYLASGENYPDALAGAVLAAKDSAPIVLVNDALPAPANNLLLEYYNQNLKNKIFHTQMTVLGGPGVISNAVSMAVDYAYNYGRVNPGEGRVSNWAGSTKGYRDGKIEEAQFAFPYDALQGASGTIYISDTQNHLIRAIDRRGEVQTYAGRVGADDEYGNPRGGFSDGVNLQAQFNEPKGLALDPSGAIYVADFGNGAIRVLETNGTVRTLIQGLNHPSDLVVAEDGDLYVSETLNHRLLRVKPDGTYEVLAGGGYEKKNNIWVGGYLDGIGEKAQFNEPTGLSLYNGILYVADSGNQRIRSVTRDGGVKTVAGSASESLSGTSYLQGGFKDGAAAQAEFNFPQGVAVRADGTILVADTYNHAIRVIHKEGTVETLAGDGKAGSQCGYLEQARFEGPTSILLTPEKNLFILDQMNHRVRELQP